MKTLFAAILGLIASAWQSIYSARKLTRWAFTGVRGAYSIVNRNFGAFPSSYLPSTASTATTPGPSVTFADMTMVSGTVTSSTINTGIAGLQWVRLRFIAKTLSTLASTGSIQVTVQAGTGAALTGPTNICQATVDMITGDTALLGQAVGWSNAGFQSYAVTVRALTAAGAVDTTNVGVVDVEVDVA